MAADSASSLSNPPPVTVKSVFEHPCYEKVMDAYCNSMTWMDGQAYRLRGFVNGSLERSQDRDVELVSVNSPAYGDEAGLALPADMELFTRALKSSTAAQAAWAELGPHARCTHMYNMVRSLQKHQTSFGEMESLQTGKTVPFGLEEAAQMVRYLYHYAGVAMTLNEHFPASRPKGVVLVLVEDARATCPVSAWRVGEVLAAGNSLLIVVNADFCLVPMQFAQIAASGGLPKGLINVVAAPTEGVDKFLQAEGVAHVHVVATQSRCRELRRLLAEPMVPFSSYSGCGRPLAVVLEGADLHGAAGGIGQAFANSSAKGESCGVQVFVQESVYGKFIGLLRKELKRLRIGMSNDRTVDLPAVAPHDFNNTPLPPLKIPYTELPDAELFPLVYSDKFSMKHPNPPTPALFADVAPSSPVVLNTVGWPVALVTQFRTAKESVTLVNSALHHAEVSVWTERLPLALELAHAYRATSIFLNGQGLRDASVEFGSRAGIVCGDRGLLTFLRPAETPAQLSRSSDKMDLESFGAKAPSDPYGPSGISSTSKGGDLTTYKMFYGGQQKRSVSNACNTSITTDRRTVGYFPEAGRKDVRNAVEAALAGFKTWSSRSAHNRAQVLYYLAENLQLRKAEMAALIRNMNNRPEAACEAEVSACIRRLFYWAATCDKDAGSVRSTTIKGTVVRVNEPVGIIGIACSEDSCLLGNFVSAMAAALAAGNSVVVLASKEWPQPALRFCQILETSDVPPGVVNVLSGKDRPVLLRALAEHHDVSAIWYHGQADISAAFIEYAASHNDKRTWVFPVQDCTDQDRHWMGWQVAQHTTQPKSIWLPYGDTFSN